MQKKQNLCYKIERIFLKNTVRFAARFWQSYEQKLSVYKQRQHGEQLNKANAKKIEINKKGCLKKQIENEDLKVEKNKYTLYANSPIFSRIYFNPGNGMSTCFQMNFTQIYKI